MISQYLIGASQKQAYQEGFANQQHINVGSFPKDFQYGDGDDVYEDEIQNVPPSKPSIILMGMRGFTITCMHTHPYPRST